MFFSEELQQIIGFERSAAANRAATRIQSWVRRHLALKNWPKLRLSLQQVRQQRALGQTQQHPGLDHSAYDVRTYVKLQHSSNQMCCFLVTRLLSLWVRMWCVCYLQQSLPVRIPPGRNYTVVGSLKVMFPQWRVMKSDFPGRSV